MENEYGELFLVLMINFLAGHKLGKIVCDYLNGRDVEIIHPVWMNVCVTLPLQSCTHSSPQLALKANSASLGGLT